MSFIEITIHVGKIMHVFKGWQAKKKSEMVCGSMCVHVCMYECFYNNDIVPDDKKLI